MDDRKRVSMNVRISENDHKMLIDLAAAFRAKTNVRVTLGEMVGKLIRDAAAAQR